MHIILPIVSIGRSILGEILAKQLPSIFLAYGHTIPSSYSIPPNDCTVAPYGCTTELSSAYETDPFGVYFADPSLTFRIDESPIYYANHKPDATNNVKFRLYYPDGFAAYNTGPYAVYYANPLYAYNTDQSMFYHAVPPPEVYYAGPSFEYEKDESMIYYEEPSSTYDSGPSTVYYADPVHYTSRSS